MERIKMDIHDFDENIAKPNRRKRLEPKKHSTIVGPLPPTGIHEVDRRKSDRRLNQALKKAVK